MYLTGTLKWVTEVTSSYSCGLWVLAVIAAVLRGCHMTSLVEDDMGDLRRAILRHVIYL